MLQDASEMRRMSWKSGYRRIVAWLFLSTILCTIWLERRLGPLPRLQNYQISAINEEMELYLMTGDQNIRHHIDPAAVHENGNAPLHPATLEGLDIENVPTIPHGYCNLGGGGNETREATARCKTEVLKQFTGHPQYPSLMYNVVGLAQEYKQAVSGTILEPLPNYRNPCWFTAITQRNTKDKKPANVELEAALADRLAVGSNWRLRCFPAAFLIGAAKSGTTDLYKRLSVHTQILRSPYKENFYWNWRRLLGRRLNEITPDPFSSYLDHFNVAADGVRQLVHDDMGRTLMDNSSTIGDTRYHPAIAIDGTAINLHLYNGWERIPGNAGLREPRYLLPHTLKVIHPGVKVIVILRNPTDRAYSNYVYDEKENHSPEKFHKLVDKFLGAWHGCRKHNTERGCAYNYTILGEPNNTDDGNLRASIYSVFVRDWLMALPKGQVKVIHVDDYNGNETNVISDIIKFLGLDPLSDDQKSELDEKHVANTRQSRGFQSDMLPETRELLVEFYRPFNRQLAQLLGDDRFAW